MCVKRTVFGALHISEVKYIGNYALQRFHTLYKNIYFVFHVATGAVYQAVTLRDYNDTIILPIYEIHMKSSFPKRDKRQIKKK